ncbi:MAG: hypothetical protein MUP47_05415 [Phycisphaerae bacterium]|nr:hypothetical protein [Phycisphaerae bacterium]
MKKNKANRKVFRSIAQYKRAYFPEPDRADRRNLDPGEHGAQLARETLQELVHFLR